MSQDGELAATRDMWKRIMGDPELAHVRQALSIHEIRTICRHAVDGFVDTADSEPYDPQGPEVATLHEWFYRNSSPANWGDDGTRSENARDLLNTLAKAGFILIPTPRSG